MLNFAYIICTESLPPPTSSWIEKQVVAESAYENQKKGWWKWMSVLLFQTSLKFGAKIIFPLC